MKQLRISPDLALPMSTVTSTLMVLGGKGMGKTNLGAVIVEEMSKAGLRWRFLDPIGVSWGLRHSADGKGRGVECLILGGAHGDIPIEPTAGAVVADFLVDEDVNVIVDFSRKPSGEMWSVGEKTRFLTELALRCFQRQGSLVEGRRRDPFFMFLDEAARFIPQQIPAGNPELAKCVGAWEQIAEEGRNIGIGVGFLTLRSARINKSVVELADVLFAFRTVGPNSLGAITDWLGEHVPKEKIRTAVEQIRQLDVGRAMVVSPGWLKYEGIVQMRLRETFDSSATPRPGERQKKVSGAAAAPDLAKYADRMKETIDKAKATDPRELQKEIARLKGEIVKAGKLVAHSMHAPAKGAPPDPAALQAKVDRAVAAAVTAERKRARHANQTLRRQLADVLQGLGARIPTALVNLDNAIGALKASLTSAIDGIEDRLIGAAPAAQVVSRSPVVSRTETLSKGTVASSRSPRPNTDARNTAGTNGDNGALPKGERVVLTAIAQHGDEGVTREQLTVLTGYKRSTRDTYIQRMQASGRVAVRGDRITATDNGLEALGSDFEPLPTGTALYEHWMGRLPAGEAKILGLLGAAYPDAVDRETISAETHFARSSRDTYIQRMKARKLVLDHDGGVRMSDNLHG